MDQSIPSLGICRFVLEKLQMPHNGADPTVGLKNRVDMPHPGQQHNCIFPEISCKYHILWKISNIRSKREKRPTQIASSIGLEQARLVSYLVWHSVF